MRAADTNVVLRLIMSDDEGQAAAAATFIKEGAWISLVVLTETVWNLSATYRLEPKAQIDIIEMLLSHESLVLQDFETVTAALDLFRKRPSLGFSDCLILELARKAGHLPLGTFDRALSRTAGAQRL